MLTTSDLSYSYGAVQAVNGVSIEAKAGQITCIMGRNGVGKTTLLRTLMGQLKAKGGSVGLDGRDVTTLPAHLRSRAGIALVPQGREIFPKLTVWENLEVGLMARTDRLLKVPESAVDAFPILRQFAKRAGGDLSGGQQQQLAIARALVGGPKVLLLDEPTEGIQPNIIQDIGRVLQKLAAEGLASGTTAELTDEVVARHLSV